MPTAHNAIEVAKNGDPAVLQYRQTPLPALPPTSILVRNEFIGVNFIDIYQRRDHFPVPTPFVPGQEGAGVVEEVGSAVRDFCKGDRVGYLAPASYAEYTVVPADRVVKLPNNIDTKTAAAVMLQGATAVYLATDSYPVQRDDWVLIPAAAGGVGTLLCQLCLSLGANVIGTTSSPGKVESIKALGVKHVVASTDADKIIAKVHELTAGKGVKVAYDGVGRATFESSLGALCKRGRFISFGDASGAIGPIELGLLTAKCLSAMRTSLISYASSKDELRSLMAKVFELAGKTMKPRIHNVYPLKDAAVAHADLEAKKTEGKLLLQP